MHDGRTRKVKRSSVPKTPPFLESHAVSLTMMNGPAAGMEYELDQERMIAGRSASTAIQLDFESISSEHAAFEVGQNGFGVRDLASTNGVLVNGKEVLSHPLEHGDRVQLGDCELQYVALPRECATKAIALDDNG